MLGDKLNEAWHSEVGERKPFTAPHAIRGLKQLAVYIRAIRELSLKLDIRIRHRSLLSNHGLLPVRLFANLPSPKLEIPIITYLVSFSHISRA